MAQAPRKRRFGVSLDAGLADSLDRLAEALHVDRSRLVEKAVRLLLEDYRHYLSSHDCIGLLVVSDRERLRSRIFAAIEKYRDIVLSSSHVHGGGRCVEIIAVQGPSQRIRLLHRELEELGCRTRFIPLH